MRKYRLTKITVKTREIIYAAKGASPPVCPFCRQPLPAPPSGEENAAVSSGTKKLTAELPPVKFSGDR